MTTGIKMQRLIFSQLRLLISFVVFFVGLDRMRLLNLDPVSAHLTKDIIMREGLCHVKAERLFRTQNHNEKQVSMEFPGSLNRW